MTQNDIVQKLWNLCDVLRDDGINYSDYVTELVLLLFIKMEHENKQSGILAEHKLPDYARWTTLSGLSGLTLLKHYRTTLLKLNESDDPLIAAIYADAQTSLKEARHLEQLIKSLDSIDWFSATKDGLGDLYEGLLEKNASETKSGAGQYFTPRPLIDSIIALVKPQRGETIQDPAAGTAGFLIAADTYIKVHSDQLYDLNERQREFQRNKAFLGMELVTSTRRLALMNCLLHGMEGDAEGVVHLGNTLGSAGSSLPKSDIILSNPPFGTAKGGGGPTRDDLTYATSNKQLAFLQHIVRHLKDGGRAAVVLPDNVLFEAGVGTDIRARLDAQMPAAYPPTPSNGHLLCPGCEDKRAVLPEGRPGRYRRHEGCMGLRHAANMPKFGKRTPLTRARFATFEEAFGEDANGLSARTDEGEAGRFRCFSRAGHKGAGRQPGHQLAERR